MTVTPFHQLLALAGLLGVGLVALGLSSLLPWAHHTSVLAVYAPSSPARPRVSSAGDPRCVDR